MAHSINHSNTQRVVYIQTDQSQFVVSSLSPPWPGTAYGC